ncbi:hypothetical protein B0T21DRAFT_62471 [Apiosordaria backusii]|uniref:Uncharacterized protein n=1 Tax=Apiosordaria backusii TaxID=314023 RepID=A0AA40DYQ2_9PEZI|nr:hypothetical protein B0T21DRAFT_62471 [Apiosordaria backusii]
MKSTWRDYFTTAVNSSWGCLYTGKPAVETCRLPCKVGTLCTLFFNQKTWNLDQSGWVSHTNRQVFLSSPLLSCVLLLRFVNLLPFLSPGGRLWNPRYKKKALEIKWSNSHRTRKLVVEASFSNGQTRRRRDPPCAAPSSDLTALCVYLSHWMKCSRCWVAASGQTIILNYRSIDLRAWHNGVPTLHSLAIIRREVPGMVIHILLKNPISFSRDAFFARNCHRFPARYPFPSSWSMALGLFRS